MRFGSARVFLLCAFAVLPAGVLAQASSPSNSSSSKSAKPVKKPAGNETSLEPGAISNGVYRNKSLALTCKIPQGWVLRTDEMNTREEDSDEADAKESPQGVQGSTEDRSRVLFAAFSRPPDARGQEINASILIAVEPAAAYPGLTDAAQYFGPLTEVAKAQGFDEDEEPYEFAIGIKKLVRADFHKDVGTRVMRQSTLAFLAHGYAVSITVIGGTEDEVEELVEGVSFAGK